MSFVAAIDQGTTSTRSILFDSQFTPIVSSQQEFEQSYPNSGWVEHNPAHLLKTTLNTLKLVTECTQGKPIDAIGITNQRETTLVWDRRSGQPIYPAIVWQDRRTAPLCAELKQAGLEDEIVERTGLLLDPYFSATKIAWMLNNVGGARRRAERGDLLFGTVDTYLIWHLTGGSRHVTDATNASRTMLFNIESCEWDRELLRIFEIPESMLPEVLDCASNFGTATREACGIGAPICGVAGDQQAATVGQACFDSGMVKSTYGTGCFALLNTGGERVVSKNRLLTTLAYKLDGQPTYALEGSIFVAGAAVQWLRDGLGIIKAASDTESLVETADSRQGLCLVPAFTGLGAPYWDSECRGAMFGLTRNSGPAEFVRAALESVAMQSRDLVEAMRADFSDLPQTVIRVDGGMAANNWVVQAISDQLNAPVDRPEFTETTALGAAYLAALQCGIVASLEDISGMWRLERRFTPKMSDSQRSAAYTRWQECVARTLSS
ncbi:MAG: glycerol kinase GlpK [Rhodobacteraceae bacterium]|nr:glycerol kinase GlpK [Paracoccaceae bacterium]